MFHRSFFVAFICITACKTTPAPLSELHSDHIDGPATKEHSITDISDVYAFPASEMPGVINVIVNFHPLSRQHNHFSDKVDYEIVLRKLKVTRDDVGLRFVHSAQSERKIVCRFKTPDDHKQHSMSCDFGRLGTFSNIINDSSVSPLKSKTRIYHGLRADHFFFNSEFAISLAVDGKLLRSSGSNTMDNTNILTVILQFNIHELFGEPVGLTGISVGSYTHEGGRIKRIDHFGRPEVTNVTMVNRKDADDIRDEFNVHSTFAILEGAQQKKYTTRIIENLDHYDAADQIQDWSLTGKREYARLIVDDFLVLDASKTGKAKYFDIEKELLAGREPHAFGGRGIEDDIMDTLFSMIVTRGKRPISDGVDRPYKPSLANFPYLAEPDSSWSGWAKARLARWSIGAKENK
jgi:hypothetical protein